MKSTYRLPCLAALLLAAAGCSRGAEADTQRGAAQPAEAEALFAKYDATADGWLSGTELAACACGSYDADGNGEVTRDEFLKGQGGLASTGTSEATPAGSAAEQAPAAEAPAAAAPAQPADGIPEGVYACMKTSMRGMPIAFPDTRVSAGGEYEADGTTGRFGYDAATRKITWESGVNAHPGWSGQYYPPGVDGMDVPTFEVRPDNGPAINCKLK